MLIRLNIEDSFMQNNLREEFLLEPRFENTNYSIRYVMLGVNVKGVAVVVIFFLARFWEP